MINKISKILFAFLFVMGLQSANAQTIRIASVSGPDHHHNKALNWFADKVNKQNIGVTFKVLSAYFALRSSTIGFRIAK